MLETPKERVRLLKAGVTGKTIEELYVEYNNLEIARVPVLFVLVEIDARQNKNIIMNRKALVECA